MVKRISFYILLIVFLIVSYFFVFNTLLTGYIFPKVYCCEKFNIGYLKKDQAQDLLEIFVKKIERDSFTFYAKTPKGEKQVEIDPRLIALQDPDLSRSLIDFQTEKTVDLAYKIGRTGSFLTRAKAILESYFKNKNINFIVDIQEDELKSILQRKFKYIEKKPINPGFKLQNNEIVLTPGESGYSLDYEKGIKDFYQNLQLLENKKIKLVHKKEKPKISQDQKNKLLKKAQEISEKAPYQIVFQDHSWSINSKKLLSWLEVSLNGIRFKKEPIKEFLKECSKIINIPPQKGRLEIKNGKVVEFMKKKKGRLVEIDKTLDLLESNILKKKTQTKFVVNKVNPPSLPEDLDSLGIEKLIGQGQSNFAGSPKNRRHNIRVGADQLHGLLIKPDQEFSLVESLGEIDKEHGFLPELVIKEDRTVPEYGGGLCQIATTMFRAALDSGLPITERRNHSYRVGYYEPPIGMDATVYIPRPDLRFINDMNHHILVQAEIKGNELIFKLYGTPDGREVITSQPKVFNIKEPGPPKIIKTDQLPPGEKEKVETAHKGAEAVFTNTVIFDNGIKREKKWKSYYKAWPEVWMVGKEKESQKENNN